MLNNSNQNLLRNKQIVEYSDYKVGTNKDDYTEDSSHTIRYIKSKSNNFKLSIYLYMYIWSFGKKTNIDTTIYLIYINNLKFVQFE